MRNFWAGLSGGTGAFAAAGVFVVLIAVGFWVQSTRKPVQTEATLAVVPPPDVATEAPAAAQPVPVVTPPAPKSALEDDPVKNADASDQPPPKDAPAPAFDEVRREEDGVTVIAGRAAPGARIDVLQNGVVVASATADGRGKFATIALIPPDGQGHVLTLLQQFKGAERASDDEIILAPLAAPVVVVEVTPPAAGKDVGATTPAEPANAPASASQMLEVTEGSPQTADAGTSVEVIPQETVPDTETPQTQLLAAVSPTTDTTQKTQTVPTDDGSERAVQEQPQDPQPQATAPVAPAASPETKAQQGDTPEPLPQETAKRPTEQTDQSAQDATVPEQPGSPQIITSAPVLKSTADGVELLNTQGPDVMDNVAIDTISYSEAGNVQLSGRAQSEATSVRVYLDNNAVVNLPVDAQGRWRGDLPDVDEGIYTLRVDEVAASGQVTSRVETPFKREAPEVLAAVTAGLEGPIKAITVQKGATLWAIARDRYGSGELYVRVFEANKEAIRDPDLIYPGQIFDLPD